MSNTVKGYKVFNPDWTCREKKYTCPGKFEENVDLKVCKAGMHFCRRLRDCFNYYEFDPRNKVAEVIAYGYVITKGDKNCTNKLEIVRELSWVEVLDMVSCGVGNTGDCNAGNHNAGDWNTGNWNTGDYNAGVGNTGIRNTGNRNTGNYNTGKNNTGNYNTGIGNAGDYNKGDYNTNDYNAGDYNVGSLNIGKYNTGSYNIGDWNTGSCNKGGCNTGRWNIGNSNTGDYNIAHRSTGCFNTREQKFYMFDKPTDWTYIDWCNSAAHTILSNMPQIKWKSFYNMTDAEKKKRPESKVTGGYLKATNNAGRQKWWDKLPDEQKDKIKALPNFEPEIFKKVTGIDVEEEK